MTVKRVASDRNEVDRLKTDLGSIGWTPDLSDRDYKRILGCKFRKGNASIAAIATQIARDQNPITLRGLFYHCLLYTSPSPRDRQKSRMPSSA